MSQLEPSYTEEDMSKFKAILETVSSLLGGNAKAPVIPAPAVPAAPAPVRRTDTGASIAIGSDNTKNQRVSGRSVGTSSSSSSDVLGNLGRGSGLNI